MWEQEVVKYQNVNDFDISQEGINLITHFEGVELDAYPDTGGVWTIGYGHTEGVRKGQRITQAHAEEYLKSDLKIFVAGVKSRVKVPVTQYQFDALVSFAFNLGLGALGKSTLLDLLNTRDYQSAAEEFLKWVYVGKKDCRLPENNCYGIVRRREAEKKLFQGGGFQ